MQTFHLNAAWRRWAPTLVVVAGGTVLLPWQPQAQTQAPVLTQAPKEAQSGSFAQKTIDNRTIQLGEYTLKLVDAGKQQRGFVSAPLQGVANPFRPNLTLSLDITAGSKDNLMLLQGVENLHGLDDRGRVVRSADRPSFPQFGRTQEDGVRRETLSLQTEDGAKSLKTLEGNLLMELGAARTFNFSAEELRPDTSKKMSQVTVTIDFAKEEPGDTWMYVTYLSPHFNPPRNAVDSRRTLFYSGPQMQVEVVGTDGVTYRPNGQSEMSGPAQQRVVPGGVDDGAPSITITKSHLSLGFQSIPAGVHVKSVVFRMTEQQGDVVSVPFKFTDVPLPDKL